MREVSYLNRASASALVVSVVVAVGCTSDPAPPPASFCSLATSTKCEEPSSCDQAIAAGCGSVGEAISASTLKAAQDCLESGVCGVASCISGAQKSATPSKAHQELAESYCTYCADWVDKCEAQFYSRTGRLPGTLVLPFSEEIAQAVNDACTADRDTCRGTFATCATETIATMVGEVLDAELAACVLASSRGEDKDGLSGGGPQVTTCTADNCAGCCRDDKCEEGTSERACGLSAAACETCSGAQRCVAGKCKDPCGPNNCKGCCDGDTCVAGSSTDACGGDGAACSSCAAQGSFVCSNQTCIEGSCQATCTSGCCTASGCQPGTEATACGSGGAACIDCGYGRTCSGARTCAIQPNSLWDFFVTFAEVPITDKAGARWDANGVPDPYLVAYSNLGGVVHSGVTTIKTDTTLPYWGEALLMGISAAELMNSLSFEIWDADEDDPDDLIGGCTLPVTAASFDGSLQSHVCPATASKVSVKLNYRIRKPE